jgi:hypothetical protein
MVSHVSFLVTFVTLVDHLPVPYQASKRGRGHPQVYGDSPVFKGISDHDHTTLAYGA